MSPTLLEGQKIWVEKFRTGIEIPPLDFPFSLKLAPKLFPQGLLPLKRGDIVVFSYPELREGTVDEEGPSIKPSLRREIFVKRVIALPHEEYSFHGGKIHINNIPLDEAYLTPSQKRPMYPEVDPLKSIAVPKELDRLGLLFSYAAQYGLPARAKVPGGSLLVLGDKRDTSGDSRTFGFLPVSYVIGKVVFLDK